MGKVNRELTRMLGEHDALPLEFGTLEVEDHTNRQPADAKIVHHLAALEVGDAVDDLRINDHCGEGDEVRHILRDLHRLVEDRKTRLLREREAGLAEFDDERVFVRLLMKPVAKFVENGKRSTNNA